MSIREAAPTLAAFQIPSLPSGFQSEPDTWDTGLGSLRWKLPVYVVKSKHTQSVWEGPLPCCSHPISALAVSLNVVEWWGAGLLGMTFLQDLKPEPSRHTCLPPHGTSPFSLPPCSDSSRPSLSPTSSANFLPSRNPSLANRSPLHPLPHCCRHEATSISASQSTQVSDAHSS